MLNIQLIDLLAEFQASKNAVERWKPGGWNFSRCGHARILDIPTSRNMSNLFDSIDVIISNRDAKAVGEPSELFAGRYLDRL